MKVEKIDKKKLFEDEMVFKTPECSSMEPVPPISPCTPDFKIYSNRKPMSIQRSLDPIEEVDEDSISKEQTSLSISNIHLYQRQLKFKKPESFAESHMIRRRLIVEDSVSNTSVQEETSSILISRLDESLRKKFDDFNFL